MARPRAMARSGNRSNQGNRVIKRPTIGRGSSQVPPPPVVGDRERCPVCRNTTKVTTRGYLRAHRDLFGHDCYNRARSA